MALPFAAEVSFSKHLCHLVLKFLMWPTWKPQRPLWYYLQPHNALLFSYPIPSSALLFLVCSSVLLLTSPLSLATSESALSPQQGYLFPFTMPPSTSPTFECGYLCFKPKICCWILTFIFIVLITTHCSLYRSNVLWGQESHLACSNFCL